MHVHLDDLQGPGHEAQWQQNTTEVDVFVTIDDDIRSRDIEFEIYPQRMRLSANGADLLAGTFPERVQINGEPCFLRDVRGRLFDDHAGLCLLWQET